MNVSQNILYYTVNSYYFVVSLIVFLVVLFYKYCEESWKLQISGRNSFLICYHYCSQILSTVCGFKWKKRTLITYSFLLPFFYRHVRWGWAYPEAPALFSHSLFAMPRSHCRHIRKGHWPIQVNIKLHRLRLVSACL